MINYIIRQQEANKTVTLRSISKRFQKPVAEVYALLRQPWEGYDVVIHGPAEGATEVNVFEAGFAGSDAGIYAQPEPVEQPATEEAQLEATTVEPEPTTETVEQSNPKAADRRVDFSRYTIYTTVEDAEQALGYKLISVAELHRCCVDLGFKVGRMVRAFGGDKLKFEPRSPEWRPVMVGRSRHVAFSCADDLKNL